MQNRKLFGNLSNHFIQDSPEHQTGILRRVWHAGRHTHLMIKLLILVVILVICQSLFSPQIVLAQTPTPPDQVIIYFFWGEGCPHCAKAKPFLESLETNNPHIKLYAFEVYNQPDNLELMKKMTAEFGFEPHAVPTIFVGKQYWEGYNDNIKAEIQTAVTSCLNDGCDDVGAGVVSGDIIATAEASSDLSTENNNPTPTEIIYFTPTPLFIDRILTATSEPAAQNSSDNQGNQNQSSDPQSTHDTPLINSSDKVIDLPIFGQINLSAQSLLVSTVLISAIDGFNPCSLWVLSMLIALTIHTGSRKKLMLIGLIFLTVTAAIYALFITGLFSVLKIISFMGWIQILIAGVALLFAIINIKDYFWYKEGISFTISDEKKPGIFKRIRAVMDASQSFWGLTGATVVLAAGVSLVEFSCTAGFPVLWTNLLLSQNVAPTVFVGLLLLYMVIYQFDELVIFSAAVITLKTSRLEEKQGRVLKLIGGMLMLTLATVMVINPKLMNDLGDSIMIFGIAFGATGLVLLVHRVILPRMGIIIGTENQIRQVNKRK